MGIIKWQCRDNTFFIFDKIRKSEKAKKLLEIITINKTAGFWLLINLTAEITCLLKNLASNYVVGVAFIDLSETFDWIYRDHIALLSNSLTWSYSHAIYVHIEMVSHSVNKITIWWVILQVLCLVPQGSIVGPNSLIIFLKNNFFFL